MYFECSHYIMLEKFYNMSILMEMRFSAEIFKQLS